MQNQTQTNAPIFGRYAKEYWAKGLPVIPLHRFDERNDKGTSIGKAPIPKMWQNYHNTMPDEATQNQWLSQYANNNMGLPLGEQSRCVALDIDTDNDTIIALIDRIVPSSPWVRIGKKGKVCMFRYNGESSWQIRDMSTGGVICELLSTRRQVVLPPSIHPDTQAPYTANAHLPDVIDNLPYLPKDLETILRGAFSQELNISLSSTGWTKTVDFVSQGARDVKMTSVAGIYAQAVLRGEVTLKEAIEMFQAWCATKVEKVAGDDIDVDKGIRNLVSFMMRDVTGPKKKSLPKGWDAQLTSTEKKSLGLENTEEHVAWDYEKLTTYLREKFETFEMNSPERSQAIEYALQKIANSPDMSIIQRDQCLNYITQTNRNIGTPTLRKRLMELESNGIAGMDHTEIAKAVLSDIDSRIPNNEANLTDPTSAYPSVAYWNDRFWRWAGSHWEELTRSEILKAISSEYGHLPAAKKNSDHVGIMNVMKSHVQQHIKTVDIPGVNFANGFVDMEGNVHNHSRQFGCTYTMPYRYDPTLADPTNAPKFQHFLRSVWGTEPDYADRVRALREAIAVSIFGQGPSFARAVLLFGIAKSGKTQLLRIIEKMLPQQVVSYVTPYKFDSTFEAVSLATSYLNICGELDENKPINGATFKQIVDGSEMEGRYLYGQNFKFKPKATHWFASNHLPKTKDATEGFNRRWLILSFKNIVKKEDRIRDIGDLIAAEEREAIAAWAIGCMKEMKSQGDFTLPQSHFQMMNEMVAENDTLFFFLTSEEGPRRAEKDSFILLEQLYDKYRNFCFTRASVQPVGQRKFYARLKDWGIILGFNVTTSQVFGLTLGLVGARLSRDKEL